MSKLSENAARIQGLIEGSGLDQDKQKDAVIKALTDAVFDLTKEIETLREELSDLNDFVDSIDSDLGDLEDAFYDDEDDDDDDDDDDEDDDDDDRTVDYLCPHCGQEMTFNVDDFDFDEDYLCPNCHQPLFPKTPDSDD